MWKTPQKFCTAWREKMNMWDKRSYTGGVLRPRVAWCHWDSQHLWGLRGPSYWALPYMCHGTGSWLPPSLSCSTAHKCFLIWPLLGSLLSPLATSSLRFYTLAKPWCILLLTPYRSTVQLLHLCLCYFLFSNCFLSSYMWANISVTVDKIKTFWFLSLTSFSFHPVPLASYMPLSSHMFLS